MPATTKFREGDEVRAIASDHDRGLVEGAHYVVEYAYDDGENWPEPLYSLSVGEYSGKEGFESQLVLTRTAAQMASRALPTPDEIARAVPLDWYPRFDLNELDPAGKGAVELYGRTADGLPFGFLLRVERVWQTDF